MASGSPLCPGAVHYRCSITWESQQQESKSRAFFWEPHVRPPPAQIPRPRPLPVWPPRQATHCLLLGAAEDGSRPVLSILHAFTFLPARGSTLSLSHQVQLPDDARIQAPVHEACTLVPGHPRHWRTAFAVSVTFCSLGRHWERQRARGCSPQGPEFSRGKAGS